MKLPDKCKTIEVIYENSVKEIFTPCSKIEEFEDCYEFNEKHIKTEGEESSMVVLMKNEIKNIRFISK